MSDPAQPEDAAGPVEAAQPPDDVGAFVERMHGYCVTLAEIGTPDAFGAVDALVVAMDTLSEAMRLSRVAMAAVTPTEH